MRPRSATWSASCAVPAGQYEIVPEVRRRAARGPSARRIQHGQVTFVALRDEHVGGLQVIEDRFLCSNPGTLVISRIGANARTGASSVQTVLTLPSRQDCARTVAGLRPGDTRVSLRGEKGQLAAQTFQVVAQALTPVSLSPEPGGRYAAASV